MTTGPEGSFDQDRVFNHGAVLYDEGKFRMWYGAIKEPGPTEQALPWWDNVRCGYAESDDGIHWERVNIGVAEWNGSKENNLVPWMRHSPVVMRDDSDPDRERRYKGFYFWNAGEMREMAKTGKYGRHYDCREEYFPMLLLTSPDGIHWTSHEGEVSFPNGQVRPRSAIPQSVFRDDEETDPRKRYKAYGFMSLNLRRRGACYLWSADALHWQAAPEMPVIDPAVRGNPPAAGGPTGQIHDTVVFRYQGYYLALYQDQQDPQHMAIELAVSRDGETFYHVKPGAKIVPLGGPGSWDSQAILASMPVILSDEIRIYYGGCGKKNVRHKGDKVRVTCLPGLATVRRDGFTGLEVSKGRNRSFVETVPFVLDGRACTLHVNAEIPDGCAVVAEIVDAASDKPLKGFGADDCRQLTGDLLDGVIEWSSGPKLPRRDEQVRLRFHLLAKDASPRLYAFWFEDEKRGRMRNGDGASFFRMRN
jgi:hypothetical protein